MKLNNPIRPVLIVLCVMASSLLQAQPTWHIDSAINWQTAPRTLSRYIDMYNELQILEDKTDTLAFHEVKNSDAFSPNYSRDRLNRKSVYWVKATLVGSADSSGRYLFSVNNHEWFNEGGWEQIDIYIQQQNDTILHKRTGFGIRPPEKTVRNVFNLFEVTLDRHEVKNIFLRLKNSTAIPPPRAITLRFIDSNSLYEETVFLPPDSFLGKDIHAPFTFNSVFSTLEYVKDPDHTLSFDEISQNWEQMCSFVRPGNYRTDDRKSIYWMRLRIAPSNYSEELWFFAKNADFIDIEVYKPDLTGAYVKKAIGYSAKLKSKDIPIWLPVFKVLTSTTDTTDIYLRLQTSPSHFEFSIPTIYLDPILQHVNKEELLYALPIESWQTGFFFGICAIQFFIFLILFFITKDRSILYLSVYLTGLVFYAAAESMGRLEFNVFYFLYDTPNILGLFATIGSILIVGGLLKITSRVLKLSDAVKHIELYINLLIIFFAVVMLFAQLKFAFITVDIRYILIYVMRSRRFLYILAILFVLSASIWATLKRKPDALFFLIATLPLVVTHVYGSLIPIMPNRTIHYFDVLQWGYLGTFVLMGLVIGIRINRLRFQELRAQSLEETDRLKNRFFANFTHELRTPLTIILGMVNEIARNPQQMMKVGLSVIRRNGENLLGIVNQILDLTKLEVGKLELKLVQDDIIYYLKYLLESFHSAAEQKDIELIFKTSEAEIVMDYDPERIRQIVTNLLSNAIKFTPTGGQIKLQVAKQNGQLQLKVSDTGAGISEAHLPHIFDRFYQVSDRPSEGTGIGLALTKELVKLMNGNISVTSKVDKGTVFTVQLPVAQEAMRLEVLKTLDLADTADTGELVTDADEKTEKPLVLIVEDNSDIVFLLQRLLHNEYQLLHAKNGKDGFVKAEKMIPDLILSDVMMPEMDGFELTRQLKTHELTSHIPVVLLTALANQDAKIEGLTYGADDYIAKPFDERELRTRVRNLIASRQKLQAYYQQDAPTVPAPADPFVQRARELIFANISDENFWGSALCKALNLGPSQVHRKLKATTGKATGEFIHQTRLHRSRALLQTTDLTVSEIAYQVGYKDPAYFTRKFKAEFGKLPSEVRGNI